MPHLIRHQVLELRERGEEPDVLVNLTNDGWFWGSSELDLHFMCGVFRAVECRKPLLIAANTGFSAWIDADGRVRKQGPRRSGDPAATEAVILAESRPGIATASTDPRRLAGGGSLVICLLLRNRPLGPIRAESLRLSPPEGLVGKLADYTAML